MSEKRFKNVFCNLSVKKNNLVYGINILEFK